MSRLAFIHNSLLGLEFALATAAVVVFSLAYPDDFRSRLWENGGENGWNSNPNKRIYFYANHLEPPEIPLIWSKRLAESNLAVAMLSFVIFFARVVMLRLNYLPKYASVLYDLLLFSLWTSSLAGQYSSDYSDPEHPSDHPWYLAKGCTVSWESNVGHCRTAQAGFVTSILAVVLYGGRVVLEAMVTVVYGRQHHPRDGIDRELPLGEDEEKYSDEEGGLVVGLAVQDEWHGYDQALSPVLAFFPSDGPSRPTR